MLSSKAARQRVAAPFDRSIAAFLDVPAERRAERIEDVDDRFGDLRTDAITGN